MLHPAMMSAWSLRGGFGTVTPVSKSWLGMLGRIGSHLLVANTAVSPIKPVMSGRGLITPGDKSGPSSPEVGFLLPARGRVSRSSCKWRSVMVQLWERWNFPVWNEFQNRKKIDVASRCRPFGSLTISRQLCSSPELKWIQSPIVNAEEERGAPLQQTCTDIGQAPTET